MPSTSAASNRDGPYAGTYYDGRSAGRRDVVVVLSSAGLAIVGDDGTRIDAWRYADVRLVDEDHRGPPIRLRSGNDDDARLSVADPRILIDLAARAPHLTRRRRSFRLFAIAGLGLAGTALVVGFLWVGLPRLAGFTAAVLPLSWEETLGERVFAEVIGVLEFVGGSSPATCQQADGQAVVQQLVDRLAAGEPSPYTFRVTVLDVPIANAFALPGGRIVVLRGLLDFAQGPDEVAGVLAHELAHILHRDGTQAIVRDVGMRGLFGLILGDSTAVTVGQTLLTLSFSREAEAAADLAAADLLRKSNITADGLPAFLQRLGAREGDAADALAYLSTHPSSASRIRALAGAAAPGGSPAMTEAEWQALRAVCGA